MKILYKIIDKLFYNFLNDLFEENFRITIYLESENFKKEISMFYVPQLESKIILENKKFLVKSVELSEFGSIAYLSGVLISNKI